VTATRRFRCRPEAVPAARRFLRDALGDQSPETVDAAELMVSELATNCVRHAQTDFELAVRSGEHVRVEVRDAGEGRPRVLSPASREPTGRGLLIVEAMSATWGVIPDAGGKTVWFTLPGAATARVPAQATAAREPRASGARDAERAGRRGQRRLRRTPKAAVPRVSPMFRAPRPSACWR